MKLIEVCSRSYDLKSLFDVHVCRACLTGVSSDFPVFSSSNYTSKCRHKHDFRLVSVDTDGCNTPMLTGCWLIDAVALLMEYIIGHFKPYQVSGMKLSTGFLHLSLDVPDVNCA